MNWKTISESCPKAWAELAKEWKHEVDLLRGAMPVRDLYTHFDALGIVIQVGWSPDSEPQWMYVISSDRMAILGVKGYEYLTRLSCESAAFEKAFELRENQLTR